jgi:branched-chain amino acid transport system permease protein
MKQGFRITNLSQNKWLFLALIVFLLVPVATRDAYFHHLLILSFIYAILVSSWGILFGYMGVYSFGHQGFFGTGAYISGLLAVHLGLSPWIGLALGGIGASVLSLIISWPTFRLRGPYVAIVTLAFAEILRITCSNWVDFTRGQLGLSVPPIFHGNDRVQYYYLILFMFVINMIILMKMMKSSFGMVAVSIRESQEAAESVGINIVKYKRLGFILTSFIAGVTGAYYGHYLGILTPDVFGSNVIFSMLVMLLFGGIGTLSGPFLGSLILTFLGEYLRGLESYRFLIYGLVIILTVLFLPGGLAGGFERIKTSLARNLYPASSKSCISPRKR